MKLADYLRENDETAARFARRAGLQADAIRAILRLGGGCRVTTAQAIVRASEAQPTPSGGTISYDDLVPEGSEVTTAGPAVERFPKEVGS